MTIPLEQGLMVAGVLFTLGLFGLMIRRNVVFMLMSVEIMLNAGGLAFVVARDVLAPSQRILQPRITLSRQTGVTAGLRCRIRDSQLTLSNQAGVATDSRYLTGGLRRAQHPLERRS